MNPSTSPFVALETIFVKNRTSIILLFKTLYALFGLFLIVGTWAVFAKSPLVNFYFNNVLLFGQTALILYILTTIPGITRRFGIRHPLIQIIMLFRRYIGITVFLCVLMHYWFQRGVFLVLYGQFSWPVLFEWFGLIAFSLLFLMFMTSNDYSVRRLGPWWGKLHKVTYVVVWVIFFHVALQRISPWSILIGIAALAQISSHLFKSLQKPVTSQPQTPLTS